MRKINKKEPDFYKNFIQNNKPKIWFDLSKEIGSETREYMLDIEQNNQCAYTEKFIKQENSHLDHFIKQSFIKQGLVKISLFQWDNILTSCNNEFYGAKHKDKNIKINDYKHLINPTKENPNDYFSYSVFGIVTAKSNNIKGHSTIELLNLNEYGLIAERKAVAFQVKSMYKQFSVDEIVEIIGKFESFIKAIYSDFVKAD